MDKDKAIEQFKQTCATIEEMIKHLEITDVFEGPRLTDIMDAFREIVKDFNTSINEEKVEVNMDTIYFVTEVINSITSRLLINNINEVLECFAINYVTLVDNWNREFAGNNKELRDSCRALTTLIQAKNAFSTLIKEAKALVGVMKDIENMNRLAPRLSRHLLMELKDELENE